MRPRRCAGCGQIVRVYSDYESFFVCETCEEEMVHDAHEQYEQEEEAFRIRCAQFLKLEN